MILVTRDVITTNILLTLDDRDFAAFLYIKNDATQKDASIDLPADTSPFPSRYNLFEVPTSYFNALPDGYYRYEVLEVGTGLIIESGKLYIIPTASAEIPSAVTPDSNILIVN